MEPCTRHTAHAASGDSRASSGTLPESSFWKSVLWVAIGMTVIPPMTVLVRVSGGLIRALGDLSRTGLADPAALAADVSMMLLKCMWGIVFSLPGLILLVISSARLRRSLKKQSNSIS